MRNTLTVLVLVLLSGAGVLADAPGRFMPEHCLEHGTGSDWNDAYHRGFLAIQQGHYHAAQGEMCRALAAARRFGPRDWRFSESLDELGLIAFELGKFDLAERMQGAAIAELLLAVGPHGEPLRQQDISRQAPIRTDCASGLRVYTERMAWILERVPGRITVAELDEAPWRIFAAGYVPLDEQLAQRLDWLVAQYLLEESLPAVEELAELQRRIRSE